MERKWHTLRQDHVVQVVVASVTPAQSFIEEKIIE